MGRDINSNNSDLNEILLDEISENEDETGINYENRNIKNKDNSIKEREEEQNMIKK